MKEITTSTKSQYVEILNKWKEELRQEVMQNIHSTGLRQQLFAEYNALAATTSKLLSILQKYDFPKQLEAEDSEKYNALMSQLSVSGLRCQILVEESTAQDYEAFLTTAAPASERIN
jgi:predicted nuclease of restriction endonuclease-like RecB superfamily